MLNEGYELPTSNQLTPPTSLRIFPVINRESSVYSEPIESQYDASNRYRLNVGSDYAIMTRSA